MSTTSAISIRSDWLGTTANVLTLGTFFTGFTNLPELLVRTHFGDGTKAASPQYTPPSIAIIAVVFLLFLVYWFFSTRYLRSRFFPDVQYNLDPTLFPDNPIHITCTYFFHAVPLVLYLVFADAMWPPSDARVNWELTLGAFFWGGVAFMLLVGMVTYAALHGNQKRGV